MTTARRIATAQLVIWSLILVGLVATVLASGVTHFDDPGNQGRRAIIAGLILVGLVTNTVVIWRARRGREQGELDERDDAVGRRASELTLVALAIVVFVASIALYTAHEQQGTVPAAWLYLMSYGTLALVSLLHAAATLLVDIAGQAHA